MVNRRVVVRLVVIILPLVACVLVGRCSTPVIIDPTYETGNAIKWNITDIDLDGSNLTTSGYMVYEGDPQYYETSSKYFWVQNTRTGETHQIPMLDVMFTTPQVDNPSAYPYSGFSASADLSKIVNTSDSYKLILVYRYMNQIYGVDSGISIVKGRLQW